jgi:hypothetical protein
MNGRIQMNPAIEAIIETTARVFVFTGAYAPYGAA